MKKKKLLNTLIAMALGLACVQASAATLYVASDGKDANPGTVDRPFATLERARDEIRQHKAAGEITVEVCGGTYQLARPLELTEKDSGTQNAPVVYRARQGETVRLVGGRAVKGWSKVTDSAVLGRFAESARGQVWQTNLRANGVTDLGNMLGSDRRLELFFQDQPMTLARFPNDGFIKITELLGTTEINVRGTKGRREGSFICDSDRLQRWVGEKDPWVDGYWFWDWSEQRHPIKSLDPVKRAIEVKPPYHGYGYRKGQWFYGFNLLSELDSPGEWYLDRETGILYFWPPAPLERNAAVVSVIPALVTMKNVSYVTLRGMVLEGCRGTAIRIDGGTHNLVAGCTIRNTGGNAVSISGADSGVAGCDIYATADGGISLNGGDRRTLTPGNLFADNNHIHHYSRWDRIYHPAITLGGVGNRATHNLIDNAPHMAIGFGGNDHLIEFNEIHSVCFESNDAGAIYAGRNWSMRGTVIRNNYLHDIDGFKGKGCVGVYLDDQFSGTQIVGNIFYKVTRAAMVGGGRDCTIENNIFVDCRPAVHVDSRGLGWAAPGGSGMVKTLKAMPYTGPLWSQRYPQLVKILDDDPMAPKGNIVARNICVGGRWDAFDKKALPLITFRDNLLNQDPLFVDAAQLNFGLKDDSPALKLGFKPIPTNKIGVYQDELRASWPVRHTVRPSDHNIQGAK